MLKASSPGVVLCRLVHTHRQISSCIRSSLSQSTRSFVSSQQAAASSPAARTRSIADSHCKEHPQRSASSQSSQSADVGTEDAHRREATNFSKKKQNTPLHYEDLETRSNHFFDVNEDLYSPSTTQSDVRLGSRGTAGQVEDARKSTGLEYHVGTSSTQSISFGRHRPAVETLDAEELKDIIMDDRVSDMEYVWEAYRRLASFEINDAIGLDPHSELSVPLLFKMSRRLVAERKRTKRRMQELYLRILSVLKRLRQERGRHGYPYLKTREWNILIYYSVTGQRGRISLSAFNKALIIYQDMMEDVNDARRAGLHSLALRMEPDIVTYNSLIALAVRTDHQPAVDRAQQLLRSSNLNPDRITRLSLIRHVHRIEGMHGIISLFRSMTPDEIGADGVGAFLIYAGREGSISLVETVYQTLRQNLEAIEDGIDDPGSVSGQGTVEIEGFEVLRNVVPSEIIYNFTIQTYAYHNCPMEALQVFSDMLSTRRTYPNGDFFQPTSEVFRGLLLGFAKYGRRRSDDHLESWTWDRLKVILDALFELHETMQLSERTAWWIMTGVRKTTGDEEIKREVWAKLKHSFRIQLRGRLKELDRKYGKVERASKILGA